MKRLFTNLTRISGIMAELPPKQNQKHGETKVTVWNNAGGEILRWQGMDVKNIQPELDRLEEEFCGGK